MGELVQAGQAAGYVSTASAEGCDDHRLNLRAREIGHMLAVMGGIELMRAAHEVVVESLGPTKVRELEAAWDGISGRRR